MGSVRGRGRGGAEVVIAVLNLAIGIIATVLMVAAVILRAGMRR